ncbi:DNA internalization-related competence protein ComEC/Rec2 [Amphritea opalescens]|uniref:DNA internalization-related competence protein ComEC/Rec2 n=1 Tax=Amphritea opalescens TaxID=2490544 RepID=A0A430KQE1_9GAMM|nr:DNA internalization-related competence protein ComEC/Rec2 [Amphritea opalescens]RTE65721.1 DNA internalization-related competence protein ComEC/Rec2 [Amphritea opalescens]
MIGIALGMLLVAWLPQLLPSWVLVALLVFLLVDCLPPFRRWLGLRPLYNTGLRIQFAGFLLGILYASGWGYVNLSQRMPLSMTAQTLTVVGVVSDLPDSFSDMRRFRFDVDQLSDTSTNIDLQHLLLSWYKTDERIVPGQQWQFVVRIKPPRGLRNPGSSDYQTRLFADRINAKGYVRSAKLLAEPQQTGRSQVAYQRYQLREWLVGLPLNERAQATVRALVLGDKQGLQDPQWQILRQSGTVHLIVISGLHIGIACLFGYGIGWLLQLGLRRLTVKADDLRAYRIVPALIMASGYALLAGFSIPTQRALIMSLAMLLPLLFNRSISVWLRYQLALVLVLFLQPLSFYQPGFWLSFAAVAALLLIVKGEASKGIVTVLRTQWAVFLGLMPLLLLWIGQVTLIAPLVNLVAIPLLTFVVLPGVILGLLLCLIEPAFGASLLNGLLDYFWQILEFCSPAGGVLSGYPSTLAVVLGLLAAVLLILPRWTGVGYFGLFLLLALVFPARDSIDSGDFRATVVDVGQGLALLIETANKTLVFDTGAAFKGRSIARFTLIPLLQSRHIEHIDRLVLSHKDNDHAGGYPELNSQFEIKQVLSGSPTLYRQPSIQPCVADDAWEWEGIRFRFLQPARLSVVNENNRSCVLLVESEQCSLVIPGDIEAGIEQQILAKYPDLTTNWLVAAHHGSRYSSSIGWLQALHPDWVLFSAGFDNPYGHPAQAVIDRLNRLQLPWLNTAEQGALMLESRANGCLTKTYRDQKKRYWTAG